MTPALHSLWLAVFAASWHQSTGRPMGYVTDEDRAIWCMANADRAVNAVVRVDKAVSDFAAEVIG